MSTIPLNAATGGAAVVAALFGSLLVAIVLSVVIGLKGVRSYRESRDPGLAFLAAGILLLSGIPTSVNLVLTTATDAPGWSVATTVDLVRLLGLAIILVTIYDQR